MSKANLPMDMFFNDRIYQQMTADTINTKLLPAYKSALDNIRRDIGHTFAKHAKGGKLSWAEITQYNRLATLEKDVMQEMTRLNLSVQGTTRGAIKGVYEESYYRTAFAIEGSAQAALGFGKLSPRQVAAAILNPLDRIGWAGRTTFAINKATNSIKGAITQGIIQGQGYDQIARNVTHTANKSATEIMRIVNTETARARSAGTYSALEKAHSKGLNVHKKWVSSMDEHVRDTHVYLDGQKRKMEEDFQSALGYTAHAPRMFGVAEEDINCRCQMVGFFPGHEFNERRYRFGDSPESYVGRYVNYPTWAAKKGILPKYPGATPPQVPKMHVVNNYELKDGIVRNVEVHIAHDGTRIIRPVDLNVSRQKYSEKDVMNSWRKMPKTLRDAVDEIQLLDYHNARDAYWAQRYGMPGFKSFATGGNKRIHFYNNKRYDKAMLTDYLPKVLYHEAGHNLDQLLMFDATRFSESAWWVGAQKADVIHFPLSKWTSQYASDAQSIIEDFADAWKLFYDNPGLLETNYPNRYRIMLELAEHFGESLL